MKEITLTFSPEELKELAKQLYLARYFLIGCPEYDSDAVVDEIMNRVCATGMKHAPETNAFRKGGPGEPVFFISHELDDECDPYVELYNDLVIAEYVPYALADRDFLEQYNTDDIHKIVNDPSLHEALKAIQKSYIDEFDRYGVTHLRLEKRE